MTKTKALEQMLDNSRAVIDPDFARKIAKAFGYSLRDIKLKARKTSEFHRINYTDETANLKSISVNELANALVFKIYSKQFDTEKEAEEYVSIISSKYNSTYIYTETLGEGMNGSQYWTVYVKASTRMNGAGSGAEDITKNAVAMLTDATITKPILSSPKVADNYLKNKGWDKEEIKDAQRIFNKYNK